MTDMTQTIAPKSDQLNADDLIGKTMTIEVAKVMLSGAADQPVSIHFKGDNGKPYKPCKSMRRVLVRVWGGDGNAYVGRRMTIYRDDEVVFGGQKVGGIRISHMSGIQQPVTMALTATRASRKPFTVKPLTAAPTPPTDDGVAELRQRARPIYAELKKAAADGKAGGLALRPDVDDLLQELSERDPETYAAFQKLIPAAAAAEESGRADGPPPSEPLPVGEREGTDSAATSDEPQIDPRAVAIMIRNTPDVATIDAWERANLGRVQALPKTGQAIIRAAISDRKTALGEPK